MLHRPPRAFFLLLLCLVPALLSPGIASAHAVLLGSSPAANEQLEISPSEIRLWFNENVSPAGETIRLLDSSGDAIPLNDVGHGENATVLRAAVPIELANGSYVVVWAAVSSDGHTIRGSYVFSVGEPLDSSLAAPPTSNPRWVSVVATLARSIAYLAALGLTGALVFVSWPSRRESFVCLQASLRAGALLLAFAALLVLAAEGLSANGGKPGEILGSMTRDALLDGRHVHSAGIILFGTALAFASLYELAQRAYPARFVALAALVLVSLGFAWSGHPAAGSQGWLGIAANTVHMASAALWAGGLLVLVAEVRRAAGDSYLTRIARDFSRIATIAFPVAVLTGVYLTLRIVPSWGELLDENYGRLLLAKVVLVSAAAGIALVNRQRLLPRLGTGPGSAAFRRLIGVELAAVVAIIVVTGVLTGQPPASHSTPGAGTPSPLSHDDMVGPFHFWIAVSPGRQGSNDLDIELQPMSGDIPEFPPSVELVLTHGETGTGPFRVELEHAGGGHYHLREQLLPLSGTWTVTIAVRVSEFDQQRRTFEIQVR